jgi:hypothetical protein
MAGTRSGELRNEARLDKMGTRVLCCFPRCASADAESKQSHAAVREVYLFLISAWSCPTHSSRPWPGREGTPSRPGVLSPCYRPDTKVRAG